MLFYLGLIIFFILLIYDYKKLLHMAQQNLYNDDNRFLKWTIKDFKKFKISFKCLLIVLITLIIINVLKLENNLLINLYFIITNLIILLTKIRENKTSRVKIKFNVTARVKRLIVTNILIMLLIGLCIFKLDKNLIYLILTIYN